MLFNLMLEVGLRFSKQSMNYKTISESSYYKNRPGFKGYVERSNEFINLVDINDKGLREKENQPYIKDKSICRIAMIGDSMTFGIGVEKNETFENILEEKLSNNSIEVLNMGIAHTGTGQQLIFLKEEGIKYKPDLIILNVFVGNDFGEDEEFEIFRVKNNNLIKNPFFEFDTKQKIADFLGGNCYSCVFYFTKINNLLQNKKINKFEDINLWVFENNISEKHLGTIEQVLLEILEMKKISYLNNAEFLVVIIPTREQVSLKKRIEFINIYNLSNSSFENLTKPQIILKDYFYKNSINYLDLLEFLKKTEYKNRYYYEIDGHLNRQGHYLVAELINNRIKDKDFINTKFHKDCFN